MYEFESLPAKRHGNHASTPAELALVIKANSALIRTADDGSLIDPRDGSPLTVEQAQAELARVFASADPDAFDGLVCPLLDTEARHVNNVRAVARVSRG